MVLRVSYMIVREFSYLAEPQKCLLLKTFEQLYKFTIFVQTFNNRTSSVELRTFMGKLERFYFMSTLLMLVYYSDAISQLSGN